MAAGIGSRFGTGIKQLAKMSDNGEIIMDYSIYDAKEAGFDKVVFVIRKDIEEEFKAVIGNRIGSQIEVEYVYQELTDLPDGFTVPEGRKKPWGTGQAVLACKDVVKDPFVIINADDYYGKEAFVKLHDFLVNGKQEGEVLNMAMAGFVLKNTVSENGAVTRGICTVDDDDICSGDIRYCNRGGRNRSLRQRRSKILDHTGCSCIYEYVGRISGISEQAGEWICRIPEG